MLLSVSTYSIGSDGQELLQSLHFQMFVDFFLDYLLNFLKNYFEIIVGTQYYICFRRTKQFIYLTR